MSESKRMKKPRRISMQVKLSVLVICSILVVALGLTAISYYVFCQRVDDPVDQRSQHAEDDIHYYFFIFYK